MPDYKMLYFKLYAAVSDEIENLQKIQCESEEIIMASDDDCSKNQKININY